MAVFAATPRSTRTFLSLAAASELKWIRGVHSRQFDARRATPSTQVLRGVVQGKEEVFVVEAQPGSVSAVASLESLDVVDELPESVATPLVFTMER